MGSDSSCGGRSFATVIQSALEVYFMAAWLVFYLAARCKDAQHIGLLVKEVRYNYSFEQECPLCISCFYQNHEGGHFGNG
ncbi:hypothetical protein YC2023_055536 [Brassica napus]